MADFPGGSVCKESTCDTGYAGDSGSILQILQRREWLPTPGESHKQRKLEGYNPQGHKESDTTKMTEQAHMDMTNDQFMQNIQ